MKVLTLHDAVAQFVSDGSSICLGAQMEQMIPFSAGHEIIRQHRRDLTLIGSISECADRLRQEPPLRTVQHGDLLYGT